MYTEGFHHQRTGFSLQANRIVQPHVSIDMPLPVPRNYYPGHRGPRGGIGIPVAPYQLQYPINLPPVSEEAVYGDGYGPGQQHSLFPRTIWSPQEPPVDTSRAPPVPPCLSCQRQCNNEQQWMGPILEETQENSMPPEATQFGFGTPQPPRVMIFHPKSPMANFLGNFPPGEYVMEIRVIREKNEPPSTSTSSSDSASDVEADSGQTVMFSDGLEHKAQHAKKDKQRMKLIIH